MPVIQKFFLDTGIFLYIIKEALAMPFKLSGEAKKYIDGLSDSEIIKKIMRKL